MSRLFLKSKSDTCQKGKTMTGNREMLVEVFYGSAKDSKKLLTLGVSFYGDKPSIYFDTDESIKYEVAPRTPNQES